MKRPKLVEGQSDGVKLPRKVSQRETVETVPQTDTGG